MHAAARIRRARPSDLGRIVELCRAHAEFERQAWHENGQEERLQHALFREKRLFCFVAVLDGRVVGHATFALEFSTWRARHFCHLDCLFVEDGCRGQGIGAGLVSRVASAARRLGCSCVEWQTPSWNYRAMRFYNRLGAESSSKMRYTLDIPPAEDVKPLFSLEYRSL